MSALPASRTSFLTSDDRPHSQLLSKIIFYALMGIIVLTAIPYGTVEPWWQAIFECAVFALGILWIIDGTARGQWVVRQHSLLIPLLALIALAAVQMKLPLRSPLASGAAWRPLSFSPYSTGLVIYVLSALLVAAALLLRYTTSERRLRVLMYSVVGIGLISALFGLARHADQSGPGFVLPQLQPQSGFAQFINHNHFVFLAEMSLGLVLGLMLRRPVQFGRLVVGLTIAIPMWIAIVYSGSRGGLACMVAQVLFLALLVFIVRPGRRLLEQRDRQEPAGLSVALGTPIFLIALFLIVMVVGIVWVGGDPLASNLESVANEFGAKEADRYTTTYRSTIWPMTWEMIKDHPFAGVGFGSYWIAITRYHHGSGELTPQQAHNDYLELFASGGAVGCALALWLLVGFLKAVRVRLLSANAYRQAACLGALTGIFGVGLHSFVDFGLHITINSLVFVTLMVIATVNERTEKSLPRSRLAAA